MDLCLWNGERSGIPKNTNNNNIKTFHFTERNSDIPKHSWYIITACAGVWVGGCKKRQIEQLLHVLFSSVLLFAFCPRSAANILISNWKMSWGNSIYEHVIGPAASNVFPLGPYLNLTLTDSHCSHIRHYYPAASDHHLFPFGTGCSITAPTPTRRFMKLQFFHMPPLFLVYEVLKQEQKRPELRDAASETKGIWLLGGWKWDGSWYIVEFVLHTGKQGQNCCFQHCCLKYIPAFHLQGSLHSQGEITPYRKVEAMDKLAEPLKQNQLCCWAPECDGQYATLPVKHWLVCSSPPMMLS